TRYLSFDGGFFGLDDGSSCFFLGGGDGVEGVGGSVGGYVRCFDPRSPPQRPGGRQDCFYVVSQGPRIGGAPHLCLTPALRRHPEHDREGRQNCSELATEEPLEGDAHHSSLTSLSPASTSLWLERPSAFTMRPSARKRMRSAMVAAVASCVTMTVVWP